MTLKHQLQTSVFPVTLELATPTLATPVSIRGVLKQSVASARVDMTKYHSVLIHVAGLLHLVLDQVPEVITYEVARLLHESGMKNNDHWLNVLENTRCNENIAKAIAPFISTGNIYINDHRTMSCYTALLPHLTPSKVHINISGERADMPGLLDLLAIIAQHHLFSPLELHHCCDTTTATTTAITATTSDAILQHLQPQSNLVEFQGHLTGKGVHLLPPSLKYLSLHVLSDDHAHSLLPQLHHAITSTLHQLVYLSVKVTGGVSAAALTSLPSTPRVELVLVDLSDASVNDASNVIKALKPTGGYEFIKCVSSTLTEVGIQDMINGLHQHSIQLKEGLMIYTSVSLTMHDEDHLSTLIKEKLNSTLKVIW
nr:uncharacterized protein LOC128705915 [Cherax quadricarinatus]